MPNEAIVIMLTEGDAERLRGLGLFVRRAWAVNYETHGEKFDEHEYVVGRSGAAVTRRYARHKLRLEPEYEG